MKQTAQELNALINEFATKFASIPENEFNAKPDPDKWSKQEVIGHLIDSAHNNLRRFIAGQYHPEERIVYDQDFWNVVNDYQHMLQGDVITLWVLLNKRIVTVLDQMPEQHYDHLIDTGKEQASLKTLQWLAEDYVKHMKHHFNQVIPGAFDVVYH